MRKIWIVLLLLIAITVLAQNTRWKPEPSKSLDLELFHSIYVINLPTASTLYKNNFEFEISHRFVPPVTEGKGAFWGIDGPVNMRLGLAYAVTNDMMITLGRSNVTDNIDLQIKYKALQIRNDILPTLVSFIAGAAYNSQVVIPVVSTGRKYQYYGKVIFNTMIHKKLGVGLVPTFLYNAHIYCPDIQNSVLLGSYMQYYVSPNMSFQLEWIPTLDGWQQDFDTLSMGIELETGGHFFKIFVTNNAMVNPAQYLAGADIDAASGDWRLGFMITRVLNPLK